MHAFLSEDGIWIDLFVGKSDYSPADADLVESILKSVLTGASETGPS